MPAPSSSSSSRGGRGKGKGGGGGGANPNQQKLIESVSRSIASHRAPDYQRTSSAVLELSHFPQLKRPAETSTCAGVCLPLHVALYSTLPCRAFVPNDHVRLTRVRFGFVLQLKEVCPPHRRNDVENLVKSLKGDEEKIQQQIQLWWDEPNLKAQEEEWEDVSKRNKNVKPVTTPTTAHSTRGSNSGGSGRTGGGGGRGRGGGGRGRSGRGPKPSETNGKHEKAEVVVEESNTTTVEASPPVDPGVPSVVPLRAPQGAWAKKSEPKTSAPTPPAPAPVPIAAPPTPIAAPPAPVAPPQKQQTQAVSPKHVGAPTTTGGNVWATRGSAHLIQAEKPKPPAPAPISAPPAPVPTPVVPVLAPVAVSPMMPASPHAAPAPQVVVHQAPPAQQATNGWKQVAAAPSAPEQVMPPTTTVVGSLGGRGSSKAQAPKVRAKPTNVLNMGHWETGDADDTNLDFGFGSFGNSHDDTPAPITQAEDSGSPARPPPGLSMGGMPPMPTNAVLVHELEGKLEQASLNAQVPEAPPAVQDKPPQAHLSGGLHVPTATPAIPTSMDVGAMAQPAYGQYGMGMYNYGTAAVGNGFMAVTSPSGSGPVLGAGVVPQPHAKLDSVNTNSNSNTPSLPQHGLYGTPQSAPSSGNGPPSASAADNTQTGPAGMPPGMPNMGYNPALYYGQQPFHMGQHQGVGFNYPYGAAQFGGAVQGGFGYPQGMGQGGGYGPPYDDQGGHSGGSGGYQKNQGGYRGRNTHHNNNQYQTQYSPQQYGGQPYGMGYDHYNQRGGYGGMQDPYGMQHQQGGGFQDDQYNKGKKGGRGIGQFQQGPPPQLGAGGQPFGLQGQSSNTSQPTAGTGWANQQAGTTGGGGWSAGGPSWQGSK